MSGLFDQANQWIANANRIAITGRIVSVATARSALQLARRIRAFVEMDNSQTAFEHIRAVQRAGMMTASLSEIRFRSDLILVLGNDRMLERFPRFPEQIQQIRLSDTNVKRRMLCLGEWTESAMARFRDANFDVLAVPMAIPEIPNFLFRQTCGTTSETTQEPRSVSAWCRQSQYMTVVWSNACLEWRQADLWVERLFQWILRENESSRCAGLPLQSDYGTFQQVCTWTTGFPGRVQFLDDDFRYRPHLDADWIEQFDLEIRVDERCSEERPVEHTDENRKAASQARKLISIGPNVTHGQANTVACRSSLAGYDFQADFFRTDASVVLRAGPENMSQPVRWLNASEWLDRLASEAVCLPV